MIIRTCQGYIPGPVPFHPIPLYYVLFGRRKAALAYLVIGMRGANLYFRLKLGAFSKKSLLPWDRGWVWLDFIGSLFNENEVILNRIDQEPT